MSNKVAEIKQFLEPSAEAAWVSRLWDTYNQQRQGKMSEWLELKKFLFATDTSTTSNSNLPWKNTTTLPKLCQIRDNLFSNYYSALFPNDKWLRWDGKDKGSVSRNKAQAIQAYMQNKIKESNFQTEIGKMLYDYIDYGNVFAMPSFEARYYERNGERVKDYIGPVAVRVSPEDIVFNPLATKFSNTFKIIRSIKTVGELKRLAMTEPEHAFWSDAVTRRELLRTALGRHSIEDVNKAAMYSVDGFGNLFEYYQSDYVEILEFYGDYHNSVTNELQTSRMVTVVDRSIVIRNEPIATYSGRAPIFHVGWRFRPDNLWAMGPLDNLVGLQYRLDHMENLKADAMDLVVHPPLKVVGEVEQFNWGPGEEIHIDENGDVSEVASNLNGLIAAKNEIQSIMDLMEQFAGAPREAMGIRTPGEKTAFEVQQLQNSAGRIFQEKITKFEVELLEPLLNAMLEEAHRNFDGNDIISVIDKDIGVKQFMTVTKEDITANGILRPMGARHFAQKAQELQNLVGVFNSPLGQMITPHTSSVALTEYLNDSLGISGYEIFKPNIGVEEAAETQRTMNQNQENLMTEQTVPTSGV